MHPASGWNAACNASIGGGSPGLQQQKLVTTKRNGSLVIRGLLVRDYPIFLRLSR